MSSLSPPRVCAMTGEGLSFLGFLVYIQGLDNDVLEPSTSQGVGQSMDRPIGDYFIASSHNTYLEGDQLQRCVAPAPRHGCHVVQESVPSIVGRWCASSLPQRARDGHHWPNDTFMHRNLLIEEVVAVCLALCAWAVPHP